jgi:transcription initiation factor TFIIE subunit alpha
MEKAQVLVRSVARAFYETDHIIAVDALVIHGACSVDDLKHVFINTGRGNKEIQKTCGRLKEGGLVSVYGRQETKHNAQKPTTVEYFYIDYRRAIDATKYRVHMLEDQLRRHAKPTTEKKEYSCATCGSQWTQIEVLDNIDPRGRGSGFLCKRCNNPLLYQPDDGHEVSEGDNILSLFNKQLAHIIKLLDQIDETIVPAVTGESALESRRPVPREQSVYAEVPSSTVNQTRARPTAVVGMQTGPEKVEITLTTDSENSAAAHAAESERKARIAAQNQLPEWHTHSTVTNDITAAGQREETIKREQGSVAHPFQDDTEDKKVVADDSLDAYFKALQEEQAREAKLREQDDEDDEDEDDDDDEQFENVEVELSTPDAKRAKMEEYVSVMAEDSPSVSATPTGPAEESDADDDFEDVV